LALCPTLIFPNNSNIAVTKWVTKDLALVTITFLKQKVKEISSKFGTLNFLHYFLVDVPITGTHSTKLRSL